MDLDQFNISIKGDQVQLSQVFINLLNNSYDALCDAQNKWIKIELKESDTEFLISFIDNGAGIQEDIKQKIFNPFFTTKEFGKGTGLGLGISKAIMEKHNGELLLDSTHPHTCFIVKLPRTN